MTAGMMEVVLVPMEIATTTMAEGELKSKEQMLVAKAFVFGGPFVNKPFAVLGHRIDRIITSQMDRIMMTTY